MPLIIDTEQEFDLEDLQYDIEDSMETDRWTDAPPKLKELFHEIEWNIIDGEHEDTVGLIQPALDADVTARTLIAGPMATGIAEVGRRFKMDEYFLPEVMMSAKCMHAALAILKPLIIAEKTGGDRHRGGRHRAGRPARHREEDRGDDARSGWLHGDRSRGHGTAGGLHRRHPRAPAQIVGFSSLLTTTMNMQWETLKLITAEGLRQDVKVFVGGAPISQAWCDKIGADAYAADALIAVDKAKACVNGVRDLPGGDPALHAAMLAMDAEREARSSRSPRRRSTERRGRKDALPVRSIRGGGLRCPAIA